MTDYSELVKALRLCQFGEWAYNLNPVRLHEHSGFSGQFGKSEQLNKES